jgi:hypothetical protein
MHEQSPPRTVDIRAPKILHCIVERVWNIVEVEVILFKERVVDSMCYLWTVGIVQRPAMAVSVVWLQKVDHPNHMVPMILLKPQKSIEAARWTAWSGAFLSPFAV